MIIWQNPSFDDVLRLLPGKSSPEGMWLPAWRHMLDTGLVMQRLYRHWLPISVQNVLRNTQDEDKTEQVVVLSALLHDMGKLTPVFASKLLSMPVLAELRVRLDARGLSVPNYSAFIAPSESPHALLGAAWLRLERNACPPSLAAVIAAHHGKPADSRQAQRLDGERYPYGQHLYDEKGLNSPQGALWDDVRTAWLNYALTCCGFTALQQVPPISRCGQMILSGLLIMADWIASNQTYFPLLPQDAMPELVVEDERVDAAMRALALPSPLVCEYPMWNSTEFGERFHFSPRPLQQAVLDIARDCVAPGLMIIEAQMGVGKTEASLVAAEHFAQKCGAGGIFFALPTQATANGIFPRLLAWAQPMSEEYQQAVRLAHGTANMNQLYMELPRTAALDVDGLMVHPWMEGRKKSLLANIVIGTVDQLLMAALRQKHVMMRHLGLAGKVVVIDECHAYDAYMNVYLERALHWLGCYHVPVILLSATLPAAKRVALMKAYLGEAPAGVWQESRAYPLITWTEGKCVHCCTVDAGSVSNRIQMERADQASVPAFLRDRLSHGGCALVILNTVNGAQQMANVLRQALPEKEVMLVHARFMLEDRAAWEEKLLKRLGKQSTPKERAGLIVVATQVVEQSLDIDADVMITELCPMDLLLQRLGRLHRHKRERPERLKSACCMVLPAEIGSRSIYGDWLLQQTARQLPDTVMLPDDIPNLVQETYLEPSDNMQNDPAWLDHKKALAEQESRAKTFCLAKCEESRRPKLNTINMMLDTDASDDEMFGDATVRDGKPSIEVLMLVKRQDGSIGLVPRYGDTPSFDPTRQPSHEEALRIARQRIQLPHAVCPMAGQTIATLEGITRCNLPEWQQASALRGELFLLLDEQRCASLGGYTLQYDLEYGLRYWKEECR